MPKILVIDDERSIRNTLREILEYEKFVVDDAADGPSAIEMTAATTYDVILCDIKMPGMDGMEVLDHLLAKFDTPVIMISANDQKPNLARYNNIKILKKPFTSEQIKNIFK